MSNPREQADFKKVIVETVKELKNFKYFKKEKLLLHYNGQQWVDGLKEFDAITRNRWEQNGLVYNSALIELRSAVRAEIQTDEQLNVKETYCFNTPAGVIDLEKRHTIVSNGENPDEHMSQWVLKHDDPRVVAMNLTEIANASYIPHAQPPQRFIAFITDILQQDNDLVDFVMLFWASALTGDIADHKFCYFYGLGGNGKSTLLHVLENIMGSYAGKESPVTFGSKAEKSKDSISRLWQLRHKRLILLDEPSSRYRLSVSFLKRVTGGDSLPTPTKLSSECIEQGSFMLKAKFIFDANHLPDTPDGIDAGLRRRMRIITFRGTIPEAQRIENLAAILDAEKDLILSWLIQEYFSRWFTERLKFTPKRVEVAEDFFLFSHDTTAAFMKDTCTVTCNPLGKVMLMRARPFHSLYHQYCLNKGRFFATILGLTSPEDDFQFPPNLFHIEAENAFGSIIASSYGGKTVLRKGRNFWANIVLRSEAIWLPKNEQDDQAQCLERQMLRTYTEAFAKRRMTEEALAPFMRIAAMLNLPKNYEPFFEDPEAPDIDTSNTKKPDEQKAGFSMENLLLAFIASQQFGGEQR
jgi:P4 family phage/plasmid primase-like protien